MQAGTSAPARSRRTPARMRRRHRAARPQGSSRSADQPTGAPAPARGPPRPAARPAGRGRRDGPARRRRSPRAPARSSAGRAAARAGSTYRRRTAAPRGHEDGRRPATAAGHGDGHVHCHCVDVGTLLTVDLDVDEPIVHHRRRRGVLERLVRHHVTPVTGAVADGDEHRQIRGAGERECLWAPRVPVDRVPRMLEEIGTCLARQSVHPGNVRCHGVGSTGSADTTSERISCARELRVGIAARRGRRACPVVGSERRARPADRRHQLA